MSDSVFAVGQVIGTHYRVTGFLARGGMGEVYEAVHVLTGQEVAIKLMPEGMAREQQFRDRFVQEAQILAKLDHPNIVPLVNFFVEEGHYFLVMKHIRGESVAQRIKASGPLPVADALRIFEAVCGALEYAHQMGVVHRDIKPANILLDVSGVPKIVDFGIARVTTKPGQTKTGTALGTLRYMAPDQVLGTKAGAPADMYSLGITFFEMITGKTPFSDCANEYELLKAQVEREALPLTQAAPGVVPAELSTLIARCLHKSPDARPTATEARQVAATTLQGELPTEPMSAVSAPSEEVSLADLSEPSIEIEAPLDATAPERPRSGIDGGPRGLLLAAVGVAAAVAVLVTVTQSTPGVSPEKTTTDVAAVAPPPRPSPTLREPIEPPPPQEGEATSPADAEPAEDEQHGEPVTTAQESSDPKQLLRKAAAQHRSGKTARAVRTFKRALESPRISAATAIEARLGLGWAYFDLGRAEDAVASFQAVLTTNPQMSDAHIGLADVHHQTGNQKAALRHSKRYLEIVPNGPHAELARRIIREIQRQ